MTEPAMLVLDDVPEELDELRGGPRRRYGLEYVVICESSEAAASDRLARLAADGRPVAIVCVAAMIDTGGGEVLAMAHRLYPAAKRVLIVVRARRLRIAGSDHLHRASAGRSEDRRSGCRVRTGRSWPLQRPPLPLETSMPGVFAAGDVRQRSVKRVASVVGEGSIAATQVSQYLQEHTQ
jgi:thioredoxin reductase (NADPH)